jgi:DNA-binding transcriptional LysR family regulator
MEATTTDIIVRMVEAGLGVGIVPLLPSGAVTRGYRVEVRSLGKQIRAIDSGILSRRGQKLPATAESFVRFVREAVEQDESARLSRKHS